MSTPQYGLNVITGYGNGASTNNAMPAISNMLTIGNPRTFPGPSLTVPPIMPWIERLTPRSVNATATLADVKGMSIARATTAIRIVSQSAVGQGRAVLLRVKSLPNV